jgi:DNA-binding IclR family transcriptional regulator
MDDLEETGAESNARGGIQALDAAMQVLSALMTSPGPIGVTDLARAAGMPVSKVHRYLASFVHAGLAIQSGRSGRYNLGPFAASLGIAALARNDFVNRAADDLEELCLQTKLTALLTVWGNNGATIVRWQRAASPIATSFGLGSTFPLLTSASGRIFLAFLPYRLVADAVKVEINRAVELKIDWPDLHPSRKGVEQLIAKIRQDRLASVDGRYVPGLRAIGAPILNWQGEAEAAVTLVGTREDILSTDSAARHFLKKFAETHSVSGTK